MFPLPQWIWITDSRPRKSSLGNVLCGSVRVIYKALSVYAWIKHTCADRHLCAASCCKVLENDSQLTSTGELQTDDTRHTSDHRQLNDRASNWAQNTRSVHSFHFQASYLHLSFWRIRCWCQRNVIQCEPGPASIPVYTINRGTGIQGWKTGKTRTTSSPDLSSLHAERKSCTF